MITETELQELNKVLKETSQEVPVVAERDRMRLTLRLMQEHIRALKLFWGTPDLTIEGAEKHVVWGRKLVAALENLTQTLVGMNELAEVDRLSDVWPSSPDVQEHFVRKTPTKEQEDQKKLLQEHKEVVFGQNPTHRVIQKEGNSFQVEEVKRVVAPVNWENYLPSYQRQEIENSIHSGALLINRFKSQTPVTETDLEGFQQEIEDVYRKFGATEAELEEVPIDETVFVGNIEAVRKKATPVPQQARLLLTDEVSLQNWTEAISRYFKTQRLTFKGCWNQRRSGHNMTTAIWTWPVPDSDPVRNNEIQISTWTEEPMGELSDGYAIQAWLFLRPNPGDLFDLERGSKNCTSNEIRRIHQDPESWLRSQNLNAAAQVLKG